MPPHSGSQFRSAWTLWALLIVAAALLVFWVSQITGSAVVSDSVATLQLGENLAHRGQFSMDDAPPYRPSMYREPAPAVMAALLVKVADAFYGQAPQQEYLQGERARVIKLQNLFWFALLVFCVFRAVTASTGSVAAGAVTAVIVQAFYFYPAIRPYGIDSLFSDIPAAAVLLAASMVLAHAVIRTSWPAALGAGLLLGLFTLIKAAGLYVFIGLVGLLLLFCLLRRRHIHPGSGLAVMAALLAGFAVLVGPWLARNHQVFGTLAIADRGGLSLYTRMLKDQMTETEYRGAFYAWTPGPVQGVVGRLTGFSPQDLAPGGRLQHFTHAADDAPAYAQERAAERAGREEDAIAWYYKGRAARVREIMQAAAAGAAHPELAADQRLQREALQYMKEHPGRHLLLTLPMLWRAALVIFPALCLGVGFALWRRDDELLWFCMPAFGLIMFYALFANFEERYGIPALPVAIACCVIASLKFWHSRRRF